MYEPVVRLTPVLVNHEVNVRGTTGVKTRVDCSYLYDTICIGVPTTAEPGLHGIEISGMVSAVIAECIG